MILAGMGGMGGRAPFGPDAAPGNNLHELLRPRPIRRKAQVKGGCFIVEGMGISSKWQRVGAKRSCEICVRVSPSPTSSAGMTYNGTCRTSGVVPP